MSPFISSQKSRALLAAISFAAISIVSGVTVSKAHAGHQDILPIGTQVTDLFADRPESTDEPSTLTVVLRQLREAEALVASYESAQKSGNTDRVQPLLQSKRRELSNMGQELRRSLSAPPVGIRSASNPSSRRSGISPGDAMVADRLDALEKALDRLQSAKTGSEKSDALASVKKMLERYRPRLPQTNFNSPVDRSFTPSHVLREKSTPTSHKPAYIKQGIKPGVSMTSEQGGGKPTDVIDRTVSRWRTSAIDWLQSLVPPSYADVAPPSEPDAGTSACYAPGTQSTQQPLDLDLTDKFVADINTVEGSTDKEIAALARRLGYSPVRIIEYVSNNIRYELYSGGIKGAAGTLQSGAGNDIDQAALTIALLRMSKVPARYVRGNIYIEEKLQHLNWLKVKTLAGAKGTLGRNNIGVDDNGGAYYQVNGRPAITIGHAWVEACVPYSNYRGTAKEKTGYRWVAFDPSYKVMKRIDGVSHTATFDYGTTGTGYLAHRSDKLPFERYDELVLENIRALNPNLTLADVGTRWEQQPVRFEFLPDTLPYQTRYFLAWDNSSNGASEVATLPANWRVKLGIAVRSSVNVNNPPNPLDANFDMIDAVQGRLTLSFDGSTAAHQTTLNSFRKGGATGVAYPCTVQVVPVLRVTGNAIFTGSTPLNPCDGNNKPVQQNLYLEAQVNTVILNRLVYNNIDVADYYAIAAYGYQASEAYLAQQYKKLLDAINASQPSATTPWDNPDALVGQYLHLVLTKYLRYVADGFAHIGQLNGETGTSGISIGLARTRANVIYALDLPFAMASNNFVVDVAGGKSSSSDISNGVQGAATFKLDGYNASALESYIWQENALKDAVSTVSGLQLASDKGIPLITLTGTNDLSQLDQCATSNPSGDASAKGFVDYLRGGASSSILGDLKGLPWWDDNYVASFLVQYITSSGGVLTQASIDAAIASESQYCYPPNSINLLTSLLTNGGPTTTILIPKSPVKYPVPAKIGGSWVPSWIGLTYILNDTTYAISSFNGGYTVPTYNAAVYNPYNGFINPYNYSRGYDISPLPNWTTLLASQNLNRVPPTFSSAIGNGFSNFMTAGGDPVNMVTGNLYHAETDFSVPAPGLPITFQRTYNSRDDKDCNAVFCPLGRNWTHSFNQYVTFTTSTDPTTFRTMVWVDGSGAKKFFQLKNWAPQSNGAFGGSRWTTKTGPVSGFPGVSYTPNIKLPDGYNYSVDVSTGLGLRSVTIREKNGLVYFFNGADDWSGTLRLDMITDRMGQPIGAQPPYNNLKFNYQSGVNRNTAPLVSVVDSNGRTITFTNDASHGNRISQVTDWSGRTFQYHYDAAGNLMDVVDPNGTKPGHYDYYAAADGPSHENLLRKITQPNGQSMTFEYYASGKVFRQYDALNQVSVFTYNDFRREATMVDPRGNTQKYIFNKDGMPLQITEADGGSWFYQYTDTANPLSKTVETDPMGYVTRYAYDSQGNTISITHPSKLNNPAGDTTENLYFSDKSFGQPRKIKDANGNYTLQLFDDKGNRTDLIVFKKGVGAAIDPDTYVPQVGDILVWQHAEYDLHGNATKRQQYRDFINKTGPYTTYSYQDSVNANANNILPVSVTYIGDIDGDGVISSGEGLGTYVNQYDALGRLTSGFNDALYSVSHTYDALGKLLTSTDDVGKIREYSYDAAGLPTGQSLTVSSAGSALLLDQSTMRYDAGGRKIASTDAAGAVTAYSYDANGNLIALTTPDGYRMKASFDAKNRVIASSDAAGHTVKIAFDLAGRVTQETDPNGNTTKYVYYGPDQGGRLKQKIEPADTNDSAAPSGRITTFKYDAMGNVTDVTDSAGRQTHTDYDPLGRPERIVGPIYYDTKFGQNLRPVTTYVYNNLGHHIQTKAGYTTLADYSQGANTSADQLSVQMTYVYDDFGRLLRRTDPGNNSWSYTYDNHGNVITSTDAKNQVSAYTYYDYGLLQSRSTLTGTGVPGEKVIYNRNALGQVLEAIANNSHYTYHYDAAHRLQGVDDRRANKNLTYSYSIGGLLNRVTDNDGHSQSYLYDPTGRLTGIRTDDNKQISYFYDAGGRVTQKVFPNGVSTDYAYFNHNRPRSIVTRNGASVFSLNEYTYDDAGNVTTSLHEATALTSTINGANKTQSLRYAYDGLDRLTVVQDGTTLGILESGSYDPFGNRYSWSADGSVGNTLYYTVNNLQQVTDIRTGSASGPVQTTLTYDANGNMVQRNTPGASKPILGMTYDVWDRMIQVADAGFVDDFRYDDSGRRIYKKTVGGIVTNYLYNGANIFAEYGVRWGAPSAVLAFGPHSDEPLFRKSGTTPTYYHADALGSIVATSDAAGAQSGATHYSAWGNRTALAGASTPPFTFAGREQNTTSEVVYMRARYYIPSLGRFSQPDPMGFADGINRYAYVKNSPTNYVDPSGLLSSRSWQVALNQSYAAPIQLNSSYTPSYGSANMAAFMSVGSYCTICSRISVQSIGGDSNKSAARFMLGFIPGYDLAAAIANPDATATDYAVGILGIMPGLGRGLSPEAKLLSGIVRKDTSAASANVLKVETQELTWIYRAVGPAELADIQANNVFRNLGSAEGKYFTTSAQQAAYYAKQAVHSFGDEPYTLVKAQVPRSIFEGLTPASVDRGIQAWVIPGASLKGIIPQVQNWMPIP